MTVTQHTALYNFYFPPATSSNGTALSPQMVLDLTDIYDTRQNASISIDESTGRIMGNGTFLPSFGAGSYRAYFCADFAGASLKDSGVYVNSRAGPYPKQIFVTRGFNLFYLEAGGFVRFVRPENGTITARVGVSFVSSAQACQNAENEIPDYDFTGVKEAAEDAWSRQLSPIAVEAGGVSDDMQTSFWSGIYRAMMSPQDYTGENPFWNDGQPYYDSYYCIWDEFRAQLPLLTIIDPNSVTRMIQSLLSIYKHEGWLPDCRMSLCKGWTQGGSNADIVLVDAYLKNLTGIDWNTAYAAILNDAENEPIDWSNEGRGGLVSWKALNYIPYLDYDYLGFGTNSRSISRTLEYSYNDFVLSELSSGLAENVTAKYLARSANWQHLWKADQTSLINGTDTGFVGFLQPKYLNGTWGYQDPIACSAADVNDAFCSLTSNPSETFESSIWEYTFFVPHDFAKLIDLVGGPDQFVKRLDFFHETPGLADIGNEPVFLTVNAYHYAGRPALSTARTHYYIPSDFNDTTMGLPGNDDSGAMGSFLAWSMMGLFPNPGQNVYLINPPFFEAVSITSPVTNKTATIRNVNFDPSYTDVYIQNATLNGEPYTKNWIGHEFFLEGWTLELTLGATESSWGQAEEDLPPSVSTSGSAMSMF